MFFKSSSFAQVENSNRVPAYVVDMSTYLETGCSITAIVFVKPFYGAFRYRIDLGVFYSESLVLRLWDNR